MVLGVGGKNQRRVMIRDRAESGDSGPHRSPDLAALIACERVISATISARLRPLSTMLYIHPTNCAFSCPYSHSLADRTLFLRVAAGAFTGNSAVWPQSRPNPCACWADNRSAVGLLLRHTGSSGPTRAMRTCRRTLRTGSHRNAGPALVRLGFIAAGEDSDQALVLRDQRGTVSGVERREMHGIRPLDRPFGPIHPGNRRRLYEGR